MICNFTIKFLKRSLLNLLSKKGFSRLNQEEALQEYNLHDKGLSYQKLIDRIDWIS